MSTRTFDLNLRARAPRAPSHLSNPAKRWWRAMVEGFDLEPHHVAILTAAAEAYDRKEEARRIVATEGLVVQNGSGVPVPHPAVSIEDASALRMARLISELGLDVAPDDRGR
jgi:P27 family predicted phage terminase small subunit